MRVFPKEELARCAAPKRLVRDFLHIFWVLYFQATNCPSTFVAKLNYLAHG